jgi:hypothetical protein
MPIFGYRNRTFCRLRKLDRIEYLRDHLPADRLLNWGQVYLDLRWGYDHRGRVWRGWNSHVLGCDAVIRKQTDRCQQGRLTP